MRALVILGWERGFKFGIGRFLIQNGTGKRATVHGTSGRTTGVVMRHAGGRVPNSINASNVLTIE